MSEDHYYSPARFRLIEEPYTETMLDGSVIHGTSLRKVRITDDEPEAAPADPTPPAEAP